MSNIIGSNRIHLAKTASTQAFALELLSQNPPEGTVISTDHQSNGMGQGQTSWISEPKANLTASIILYPTFCRVEAAFEICMVAALSVSDVLLSLNIDNQLKWPNDVLTKHGKIAGILINTCMQGAVIKSAVIGIGLNVNQLIFPDIIKATSIAKETHQFIEPMTVLNLLCERFSWYYLELRKRNSYLDLYKSRLLGLKERRKFLFNEQALEATVIDVTPGGQLVLESYGEVIYCHEPKQLVWL